VDVGPFITGMQFQHNYKKLLKFYNTRPGVHFQLTQYKRGWLHSDATLLVEITDPDFHNILISLGLDQEKLPSHFSFTVQQRIQQKKSSLKSLNTSHAVGCFFILNFLSINSQYALFPINQHSIILICLLDEAFFYPFI